MTFASERMAEGMDACLRFSLEQPPRPWVEQVPPCGLADVLLITPSGWTLTSWLRRTASRTRGNPDAGRSARPLPVVTGLAMLS